MAVNYEVDSLSQFIESKQILLFCLFLYVCTVHVQLKKENLSFRFGGGVFVGVRIIFPEININFRAF